MEYTKKDSKHVSDEKLLRQTSSYQIKKIFIKEPVLPKDETETIGTDETHAEYPFPDIL